MRSIPSFMHWRPARLSWLSPKLFWAPTPVQCHECDSQQLGQAIGRWHVDDVLEFPLPPHIPRFDARIGMPVFWMTVQVALSDIHHLIMSSAAGVPGAIAVSSYGVKRGAVYQRRLPERTLGL